jgi:hypothetical protein
MLVLGGTAAAAVVVPLPLSDHFETDTVNAAPKNWVLSTGTSDIYVVDTKNDPHPSPDPDGTKALLVDTATSHAANITFTEQKTGTVQATLLLRINSEPSGEDYRLSLYGSGGAATYLRMRPHNASSAKGFTYYSNSKHNALLAGVDVGDWYRVTMTADLDTQTWGLSVSNVTEPSAAQSVEVKNTPFSFAATSINLFQIAAVGSSLDATFDALEIKTVVPEPASLGMLGLGGMLLVRWRRPREQS